MSEPQYVAIAGKFARDIRSGKLMPGTQLPSYAELTTKHNVSAIVIRAAVDLLISQGLVRTVPRRGTFVADRPNLVRVSPERQLEDPEETFRSESDDESEQKVVVDRHVQEVSASDEVAAALGLKPGTRVTHTITRASEDGRPISISDTYQPIGVEGIAGATFLEETISDSLPTATHAEWLRASPGGLVKSVYQRFIAPGDQVVMISYVSYPRDRYEAFVFRMSLNPADATNG
ncbi:GntR family transcriptional regulator [Nocardia sp. NPDC058640]|uniref:GntR family transcriptional regulator n=1 Tax=Nocardia sp. NPDC058640 TaxID=3346571 RepID=UPI00365AD6D2